MLMAVNEAIGEEARSMEQKWNTCYVGKFYELFFNWDVKFWWGAHERTGIGTENINPR